MARLKKESMKKLTTANDKDTKMDTRYDDLIDKLVKSYQRHKSCWENMGKQSNLSLSEIISIREERAKMELLESILIKEGVSI